MMRHKLGLLGLILLVLLAGIAPAAAQGDDWSVTLFHSGENVRELLRVHADGTTETFDLGLNDNQYIATQDIAFTADGQTIAYCLNTFQTDTNAANHTLYLVDLDPVTVRWQLDLGNSIGCSASAFDAAEALVAVGLVNYFPGDPAADTSVPVWRLMLVDVASGTIVDEINADDVTLPVEAQIPSVLARVMQFDAESVTFVAVPWGVGGGFDAPAYRWNRSDDSISEANYWGNIGAAHLAGEFAWTGIDPDRPAGEPGGPVPANNVVRYAQNADADPYAIFHSADWLPLQTVFIDDGERLAVNLLEAFAPPTGSAPIRPQAIRWIAIARDGSVAELLQTDSYSDLKAAPGGFVVLRTEINEDYTVQRFDLTYTSGGETRSLWRSEIDDPATNYTLMWVTPGAPASDLAPFAPLAN